MLRPKKNSCKEFDNEKKFLRLENMQIIFHSHANKTHFLEKSCAPSLILKVRVFGTRKWPIGRNTDPVSSNRGLFCMSMRDR